MKKNERQEARRLRKEEVLSITKIADNLHVSKSSVSLWVRNIELTEEQKQRLLDLNPCHDPNLNGMAKKHKKIRIEYQKEGIKDAEKWKNEPLHMAGCMLYWAEGSKHRSELALSNSDPYLIRVFKNFLIHYYEVPESKIFLHISCHDSKRKEEIENFWLSFLSLPRDSLNKTTIFNTSKHNTGNRLNILTNGICKMRTYNVELAQRVFGSIQYYADFRRNEWKQED